MVIFADDDGMMASPARAALALALACAAAGSASAARDWRMLDQ